MNEDWLLPYALSVNGVDDIGDGVDCGEETNVMAFVFHRDLSNEDLTEGTDDLEEITTSSEEICDPSGQCCGETPLKGNYSGCQPCDREFYVDVSDENACSVCDGSPYKWVFITWDHKYDKRCIRCDSDYISDAEDRIEETCRKCGRGVDWSVNLAADWNIEAYQCAPGVEDIGERTERVTETVTETDTDTDTITVTETGTETDTVTDSGSWPEETGT